MNKRFILISMCILVIVVFSSVTGFAGTYYGPVLMVEADPAEPVGGDTIVTFTYSLWGSDVSGWQIGEVINNTFNAFEGGSVSKEGGTVVDFAIKKEDTIYKLSDKTYAVTFTGGPNPGVAEKPSSVTTWYDDFLITWDEISSFKLEVVNSDGDPDGFAPIPIPSTVWILGAGLLGLMGVRRKLNG